MGAVRVFALWAACLTLACATPVHVQHYEGVDDLGIQKIALAPFSVGIPLAETEVDGLDPALITTLVTARVMESLTLYTEFDVIPPGDVNTLLLGGGPMAVPQTPAKMGERLREAFGVQAVLFGTVHRYVQRKGSPGGATRPAAVWFELTLRSPEGRTLWRGSYDEIQQSLNDDLGSFRRAMGRGFEWVTAERLVQYGADQLVRRMPAP